MSTIIQFSVNRFLTFPISDDERAEYEFCLKERAGFYMDEGYDEKKADELALDDLGCLEFWHFLKSRES